MWHDLRCLLLGLLLGLTGPGAPAQVRSAKELVVIVSSDSSTAYMEATQAVLGELVRGGVSRYDIRLMTSAELASARSAAQMPQPRIFLALGTSAAQALAAGTAGTQAAPVLCALLPRSSFERVLREQDRKASSRFSAIYLDQPLGRQLALIHLALPQVRRLGVLWGPDSLARASALRSAAAASGLTVVEDQVAPEKGIFPALKRVLDDSDVLLALPDPQVYNSNSIQNILLSALRNDVPMVAFSPAYVQAGALLALHVTPVQAGVQAAALIQDVLHNKPLPGTPVESTDFEVSVNVHVARALNLTLDAQALRLELRHQEHLP